MLIFNVVESSFPITMEQLQKFSCKTPISTLSPKGFLGLENQKWKETGLLPYPQPPEESPAHSWEYSRATTVPLYQAWGDKQFYLTG